MPQFHAVVYALSGRLAEKTLPMPTILAACIPHGLLLPPALLRAALLNIQVALCVSRVPRKIHRIGVDGFVRLASEISSRR